MADRILKKKNLLALGILAGVMHAAAGVFRYLLPMSSLAESLMDLPLMALIFFFVLYLARRGFRFRAVQALPALFVIWLGIGCLTASLRTDPALGGDNGNPFLNAAVSFLVLFPLGCAAAREKAPALGKILLHSCMLGWTAFIAYALFCVFQGKTVSLPNGGLISMYKSSLQLNCNRNTTGAWEMLCFLGCFLMLLFCRRPALKAVYALALPIHYAALVLSNSRASVYASMLCFAVLTLIASLRWTQKQPAFRRALLCALIAAAAGAAFYFLREPLFRLYDACKAYFGRTAASAGPRELTQSAAKDLTGGRIAVWRAAVRGIFSTFPRALLGVTPRGVPRLITLISGRYKNLYYSHNQLLEIAAAAGVPGLCLALSWFALIVRDILRIPRLKRGRAKLLCLAAVVLTLALANMAEAYLLFYDFPGGYVFFFLCGVIHGAAGGNDQDDACSISVCSRDRMRFSRREM